MPMLLSGGSRATYEIFLLINYNIFTRVSGVNMTIYLLPFAQSVNMFYKKIHKLKRFLCEKWCFSSFLRSSLWRLYTKNHTVHLFTITNRKKKPEVSIFFRCQVIALINLYVFPFFCGLTLNRFTPKTIQR